MWAGKKKILVVDDEPDITFTLSSILNERGFEVMSFNDSLLTLRRFKPRYYELMILDIRMPKMDGFELYRAIKRKDNHVKVCFLTAVSEFRDYEQYRKDAYPKLGERHFIAKPVSNDELIRGVNEILTNDNYHLEYIKQTSSQNTIVSRYAKRENGTPFKNKHGEMEHLSTQVEQRQIEWRRAKVLELSSQGHSQREIADTIHVGIGTINRDMAYLRREARKNQVSHPRQTA